MQFLCASFFWAAYLWFFLFFLWSKFELMKFLHRVNDCYIVHHNDKNVGISSSYVPRPYYRKMKVCDEGSMWADVWSCSCMIFYHTITHMRVCLICSPPHLLWISYMSDIVWMLPVEWVPRELFRWPQPTLTHIVGLLDTVKAFSALKPLLSSVVFTHCSTACSICGQVISQRNGASVPSHIMTK